MKRQSKIYINKITTAIAILSLMLIPNYLVVEVKSLDILNYKQEENGFINSCKMESFEKIISIINQIEDTAMKLPVKNCIQLSIIRQ